MPWKCFSCFKPDVEDVKELNFNHHSLKEVPSDVFAHERTLEELSLEANRINDLPRALFHCHGLRVLNLSDNDIKIMPPAIASLINLQHLNLSKNSLSDIPENIKCCKQLLYVNVSVNPLEKLPEGFTQLIALEELYLNDTFLEFLPANFGRLSKLRVLDLRENNLNTLPKSIARLSNLQVLDIGRNEFSDLPEVVGNLPELRDLWADYNKIRSIPSFIGNLQNVINIDMSNNNIQWIAAEIEDCLRLSFLVLSSNELQNIPEEIGNLKDLTMLKIDDNDLESLPRTIGKLTNLEELVVSQNVIEAIPPTIGLLRKVKVINADDNRLSELPSELCSCSSLRILSVRSNMLDVMPAEIGHLNGIRVINIADNLLRNLPVSILNLTNLNALWLSTNQTTPLTTLQQEIDPRTGLMVCVNFMFPQVEQERNLNIITDYVEAEPVSVEKSSRPHIRFADSTDLRNTSRLTRAPTPYPKELRSMAKHARILVTRPMQEHLENEEHAPLLGDDRSMPDARGSAIKTATVKKPTISSPDILPIDEQRRSQSHRDDYHSSDDNYPGNLSRDEGSQITDLGISGDSHQLIMSHHQYGADENALLASDIAIGIAVGKNLSTMSDMGALLPEEPITKRIDDSIPVNAVDESVNDVLALPEIGVVHYGRTLVDNQTKSHSNENIAREIIQLHDDNMNTDTSVHVNKEIESFSNGIDPLSPTYSTQVKQPPPYHIAAIHSKQAAYFRNSPNGHSVSSSPVPSFLPSSDVPDSSMPQSLNVLGKITSLETPRSLTPVVADTSLTEEIAATFQPLDANEGLLANTFQPQENEMQNRDSHPNSNGATYFDPENSPSSPTVKCNIPVPKSKDSGTRGIPKPQSFSEDTLALDKSILKPSPQHPRESLSKIPSFTTKESRPPVAKKTTSMTSSSPATRMLQPGFHTSSQLPLPKSPAVVALGDNNNLNASVESPSNGNVNAVYNSNEGGQSNSGEPERPTSQMSITSPGFKSRIPSRVSPVKGSATSPTSPTWVFGQHKNPTVFPVIIIKNPGLGFSISGGTATATSEKGDLGIIISKVHPNGPASSSLVAGDKILEVDGVDFSKLEHDQAVGLLKQTKNVVNMMISRQK